MSSLEEIAMMVKEKKKKNCHNCGLLGGEVSKKHSEMASELLYF